MKLLIQNYSNSCTSQPLYFNECLSRANADSKIWNINDPISVYDKLDKEKPDIVLSSFQTIRPEMVTYIKSSKNIQLVIDITGINQEILDNLETLLSNENINCPFFVSQDYKFLTSAKSNKIKTVNILPSYDVFTYDSPTPDFNVTAGIISNTNSKKFDEVCGLYETYHKIIMADNPDPSFDIQANVINMNSLYAKYDEVVLTGDINFICSQVFFDGFVKSKKLVLKSKEEQSDLFNQVLATLFREEEEKPSIENIKNQIIKNHNCFNRSSQLAKALGDEQTSTTLLEMAKAI